jgi:uncharacterized protein (DUF983 family)
METPNNRMSKPGRKPEGSYQTEEAIPVQVPGRVTPHNCPYCGKGQSPLIMRRYDRYSDVESTCCCSKYQFHFKTADIPAFIRFVPRGGGEIYRPA